MLLNIRHYLQFKHNPIPAIVSLLLLSFLLSACGGGGSNSGGGDGGGTNPPGETNKPPVANAGSNQTVNEGVTVILDGSASSDPDGTIKTYSWKQTAGTKIELTKADTAKASFTAPAVKADESLSFELTVTDEQGATATSSTQVTVKNVNQAPIANAGADQTVNEGTAVTLDGSASSDPDGTIKTYSWKQTAGTKIELTKADTAKASFTAPDVVADETLTFELTVTDDKGAKAQSSVRVVVKNVSVVSKVTLSGTAFDAAIVGGTVTVKDLAEKVLGTATTNADGKFTIQVAADDIKNGYSLSVTGGTMDGVAFSDILTATYTSSDAKDAVNLTVVTTLVDSLATTAVGATKLAKREAAIQQLAKIGMVKADNWHLLISDYFSLQALTWRIKDAGGVKAWLDVVKADLTDGELSVEEMRSLFPKAHGGLESVSIYSGISVFPGDKSSTTVMVEPMPKEGATVVKLLNAPSWVKVVGNTVTAEPPSDEVPAIHTVDINVSADGVLAGRKTQLNISVLKQVTLLHGFLGPEGGKIENAWRDMAISAPAGKLTQNYEITYYAGINQNGEVITTLEKIPDMPNTESDYLSFLLPSTDIISHNYLTGINSIAVKSYANSDVFHKASQNQSKLDPEEILCKNLSRTDGDGDGFVFDKMLIGNNGDSLDVAGITGNPRVLPSKSLVIKSALERKEKNLKYTCQSALFTSSKVLDPLISNQAIDNYIVEPVLFVHGFASGNIAEIDGYFFNFPELIHNLKIGNRRFASFNFVWNTNSRFEDAANELGIAIKEINRKTKRKVHIVAHSFGGVVVRTLLQGLAEKKVESFSSLDRAVTDMERNDDFKNNNMSNYIASVTTVGSPHSGIFSNTVSATFDGRSSVKFYDGTHSYAGNFGIPLCQALSCHEVGKSYKIELFDKIFTGSMSAYDSKKAFGVELEAGEIAFRLASHFDFTDLDSDTKFVYPSSIPTQILIGMAPKKFITDTFLSNASCLSVDKGANCKMHYDLSPDLIGDELISLAGQRLIPRLHGEKKGVYDEGLIQEHVLGFRAYNLIINQDFLLDRVYEDKKFDDEAYKRTNSDAVFYNHRGGQYNYNYETKVVDTNGIDETVGKIQTPMLSEVALKNCRPKDPNNCEHATWKYVVAMLKKYPAGNVASMAQVKAKGSVGYAAPAVARTAGAAALAASKTVEGFVVQIFLDGEQLGTTTTDANGAFDLDVEFKPKRTYVLEIYSPASLDATIASRVILVKKTSGLTVEETDFDFSRLELIKNANLPQQGELGVQLKDDSTGNVLLGYNLSVTNFSNTLVDAKPINTDSDAILTLPESLYMVTTTKSGYVETGRSLCMVSELASTPCVVKMLSNNGDKDGDGLSNIDEYNLGTNLAKADTDGDGYTDKQEVEASSDPLDKDKYPALSAPQNLKATTNDGKVTLSWDTVTGANNYNVCYATVSIANFNNCASYANGVLQNTSGTGLVLSDLTNGTTYYFRVQATEASGNKSPASAETTATPQKAGLNAGLVAHWSFDDCTAKDVSGNGHDGVIAGNVECVEGVSGKKGMNFHEDDDDHINAIADASFSSTAITLSAWIKPTGVGDNNPRILGVGPYGTSAQYYSLILEGTFENRRVWLGPPYDYLLLSNNRIANNSGWHHVVSTVDGALASIYIDGKLDAQVNNLPSLPLFSNGLVQIGYSDNYLDDFVGVIDDARIYNRALSESEVKALYQLGGGVAGATGKLNDTGITTCANDTENNLACPVTDFPNQDAQSGRDVTHNDDTDGHAGFSFTKISSTGAELPASATEWSCVKDNVTGLMWEVKTDDGGLHDKDWTYSWYEPDGTKNGGSVGTQNGGYCEGTSQCDTYGFVQAVNAAGWCGAKDWRMPSLWELKSITRYDAHIPAIDTTYFPNTPSALFWSSSPFAYKDNLAWRISSTQGLSGWWGTDTGSQVRLVRSKR